MTASADADARGRPAVGIGAAPPRREDRRLLTGRGRFTDDLAPPGTARAVLLRAPLAPARIGAIDTGAAAAMPGVLAVLTAADLDADGLGDLPCESIPPGPTGGRWVRTPFPMLARDRVLAVGDPVALIVAETLAAAQDAAEAIAVDWRPLPGVADLEAALAPGAPLVHEDAPGNLCFTVEQGDAAATDAAFAAAAHVIAIETRNHRLIGAALEGRAALGIWDDATERWHLTTSTQNPHAVRRILAESVLRVPAHQVHVTARDVGGGFGTKGRAYPEDALVLWAARRLGRPVKWTADRSEGFLGDFHGRDQQATGSLALDRDGRILGLRVTTRHNLGCRLGPATGVSPFLTARMVVGPYAIPAAHVTLQGVFTHTRTTTSYRGAGRPEATFFIERLLDKAAAALGLDAVTIRRRNLVRPDQMPFRTAVADRFDCGAFETVLDKALALADWDGFPARRTASAAQGLLRGRGVCCFVEVAAIANERMEIRFDPSGHATILAGTFSHGQGHETVYPQLLAGWLGLPADGIRMLQGDTDAVSHGGGTYASRSITVGGAALRRAADGIVAQARRIAAWLLSVEPDAVRFADGLFTAAGSNKSLTLPEVAIASYRPIGFPDALGCGLEAVGTFAASPQNYPNGCHAVEVEVDPETGAVSVVRYAAVDDVGTVIHPALLEGQLHGSVAQGLGQALSEAITHAPDGQLLSGSFMDYAMPRAGDMPPIAAESHPVPTATNPLGVKGGAEVGTIAAPAAIVQAILDALAPLGVTELEMPATPARVWRAIATARSHASPSAGDRA